MVEALVLAGDFGETLRIGCDFGLDGDLGDFGQNCDLGLGSCLGDLVSGGDLGPDNDLRDFWSDGDLVQMVIWGQMVI